MPAPASAFPVSHRKLGSANGNRTRRLPVQFSPVGIPRWSEHRHEPPTSQRSRGPRGARDDAALGPMRLPGAGPEEQVESREEMPELTRFFGIVVRMYFRDHSPAHFHAEYGEYEALVEIETLAILRGELPRRAMALVLEWSALHRQ